MLVAIKKELVLREYVFFCRRQFFFYNKREFGISIGLEEA